MYGGGEGTELEVPRAGILVFVLTPEPEIFKLPEGTDSETLKTKRGRRSEEVGDWGGKGAKKS